MTSPISPAPSGSEPNSGSTKINITLILVGVVLFISVYALRLNASGHFEVKFPELSLVVLPLLLWLLASGRFETLKFGASGFQIKTALQKATSKVVKRSFSDGTFMAALYSRFVPSN